MKSFVLGTRGSALALAQAELALAALQKAHGEGRSFRIEIIQTIGDKRLDLSLSEMAGKLDKGLFTKELEEALLGGRIDAAIHSLKDLPTLLPPGLSLGAVLERAQADDVLLSKTPGGFAALPRGAQVASSSLRRKQQLLWRRPDLQMVEVRGNVATRLRKLAGNGGWSATVLAAAGLQRLGLAWESGQIETPEGRFLATSLTPGVTLPAVGQGAIGLEIRENDPLAADILLPVNHAATWQAITAERELLRLLGGGCQTPLGVRTACEGGRLRMEAVLFREGAVLMAAGGSAAEVWRQLTAAEKS